jgi:hypothetical protein
MPKLSTLGAQRTVPVTYDGETIQVTFRPAAINTDWQERLQALQRSDRTGFVELLAEALVAWDIVGDDGQALEPSVELMRRLPIDLLEEIAQAIFESLAPKRRSAERSSAG